MSLTYSCEAENSLRRGFPNKASHAPWLGNILNGPLPLAPPTIMVPVHVPSKGVRVPLAIWSTFDYLPHRDIRSFIGLKISVSMMLTMAPSLKIALIPINPLLIPTNRIYFSNGIIAFPTLYSLWQSITFDELYLHSTHLSKFMHCHLTLSAL